MKHQDFEIGQTFRCGDGLWLCTDIGRRTIVAIRIDRAELCTVTATPAAELDADLRGPPTEPSGAIRIVDPRLEDMLRGPPYFLAEHVFDEYDMPACQAGTNPTRDS